MTDVNNDIVNTKCRELIAKARFWFRVRQHKKEIDALKAELASVNNDVKDWRCAWHEQRLATGRSYWSGYASGKSVAMAWHRGEANKRKNAMNAFVKPEDKVAMEMDVRYHEYSAEKIALCGVMVVDGKCVGVDKM